MMTRNPQAEGVISRAPMKLRVRKGILSAIAILFTIAPLLSISLWIKNVYFSDPRSTMALEQMEAPRAAPKLFEEPIVSVTFDDGWESIYRHAAPVLEKYGIRTTQYILSGQFDHYNYLSEEQVLSLQKAGHDIQSHTITHSDLRRMDDQQLVKELSESKEVISELTGTPVTDFASPLNSYDERTLREIKRHYRSHRNTLASADQPSDKDFNLSSNFNRWDIIGFSVRRTTTAEQIKEYLAEAKNRNAWAVLIYHEVNAESASYYAVTPKQFDAQMKAVAQSGLRIATMDEVMDYYDIRLAANPTRRN